MTYMSAITMAGRRRLGLLRRARARLRTLDSPVLTKELRVRMRGTRGFLVMLAYVVILSLFALGYLLARIAPSTSIWSPGRMPPPPDFWSLLGHQLFVILAVVQLSLVLLFAPALTCGTITAEREQRTLELLGLTLIRSRSVVLGKFFASLCYVGLLLLCSVPIFAFTLMLGGVSPLEIVLVYLVTAAAGLFFGAQGMLASSVAHRTYLATVLAYGLTGFWIAGLAASGQGAVFLFLFGGLTLSGFATVAAYWLVPLFRGGARAARATHIAIFGFTFCAVASLLNTPWLYALTENYFAGTLKGMDPFSIIAGLTRGYPAGHPTGWLGPVAWPAVRAGGLSIAGGALSLLAAISLFSAARAPQPDAEEVLARLAAERHAAREEAS
jgi:ABC-type transport system involved in cytochrome c biogenesis permease component